MKKGVKLIDWMICDDIRREDNGKLMFIGVYESGNILVSSVPYNMPQLVFYSKWDTSSEAFKKYEFKITRPDGEFIGPVFADFTGKIIGPALTDFTRKATGNSHSGIASVSIPVNVQKDKATLQITISPFNIDVCGEYKINLKINDVVHKFDSINISLSAFKSASRTAGAFA